MSLNNLMRTCARLCAASGLHFLGTERKQSFCDGQEVGDIRHCQTLLKLRNVDVRLLVRPDVRLVVVPETNACVVLFGSHHKDESDTSTVRSLLRSLQPDAACCELCPERVGLLQASAQSGSKSSTHAGMDMLSVMVEAEKYNIPVWPVDRLESSTLARMRAFLPEGFALGVLAPWFARNTSLTARQGRDGETWLSLDEVMSLLVSQHIPWQVRKQVLDRAIRGNGQRLIKESDLDGVMEKWMRFRSVPTNGKIELSGSRQTPLPTELVEFLGGSESASDVLQRVLVFERDLVMAYRIKSMCSTRSQESLTLAVVGAAHLEGVAEYLNVPLDVLKAKVDPLLDAPEVPLLTKWLLSEGLILRAALPFCWIP